METELRMWISSKNECNRPIMSSHGAKFLVHTPNSELFRIYQPIARCIIDAYGYSALTGSTRWQTQVQQVGVAGIDQPSQPLSYHCRVATMLSKLFRFNCLPSSRLHWQDVSIRQLCPRPLWQRGQQLSHDELRFRSHIWYNQCSG